MRKTIQRLVVQFTFQFIIFCLLSVIFIVLLIFIVINYLHNEEMKQNFTPLALESMEDEMIFYDDTVVLSDFWEQELKKHDIWLQVLDEDGRRMEGFNIPNDLPKLYTSRELLSIQQTNTFKSYTVHTRFDRINGDYLYLLGFTDQSVFIKKLAEKYKQASFSPSEKERVKSFIDEKNAKTLTILDENNQIINQVGEYVDKEVYSSLNLMEGNLDPGLSVYHDEDTNYLWILDIDKLPLEENQNSLLKKGLFAFSIITGVIILFGILFTAWHAYRYGQPLILFIRWLDLLSKGQYIKLLEGKERKKILNKKGRVKYRYRLYEAVILSFYNMAQTLQNSEKKQQRLERTREEWMTGISHDLRTPLASIQGYGHVLESGVYDWNQQELKEIGTTIRDKGEYMLELVEDFSLAFELNNGVLPLNKENINIIHLLKKLTESIKNDINNKNNHFYFETDTDQPLKIMIDRKLFIRMIHNLLSNAINHNPPYTDIYIKVIKQNNFVEICIQDNGKGMDETTLTNLFDRYYRGTNTEDNTDGTGLGLSIAKGIIEVHGGSIAVNSIINKGTTLRLYFPIK